MVSKMKILFSVYIFMTSVAFSEVYTATVRLPNSPGSQTVLRKEELHTQAGKDGSINKKNHKLTEKSNLKDDPPQEMTISAKDDIGNFHEIIFDTSDPVNPKTINHIRKARQADNGNLRNSELVTTTEFSADAQTTIANEIIEENLTQQLHEREKEAVNPTPGNISEDVSSARDENQTNSLSDGDSPVLQDGVPEVTLRSNDIKSEIGTVNQPEEDFSETIKDLEKLASSPTTTVNDAENIEEETTARTPIPNKTAESIFTAFLDPITGTPVDYVEKPFEYSSGAEEQESEFPSYDINVGASLMTGSQNLQNVGVGQVIPVDVPIHEITPNSPPSTTTTTTTTAATTTTEQTEPPKSLLDTFLKLFVGEKESNNKEVGEEPPILPPPPPLRPSFSPSANLMPPPSIVISNEETKETRRQDENIKNEVDSELKYETRPSIQNEVKTRPSLPTTPSATRNNLPFRPRPTTGTRPFRPSIFAPRPNFPISKPPQPIETREELPESPVDTESADKLEIIKPVNNTTISNSDIVSDEPTLPPSLPNLQIIPFVAQDALVNRGSPPTENDESGFVPRPFVAQPSQDCREGGKVWKNGEMVAKGDDDPCVLCRCFFGKVVCQRLECPIVPDGCHQEEAVKEGECCSKIICDKSANVSIVDTLPNFRPLKPADDGLASTPIRPSAFAHQNRRPPFASANNKPKPGIRKPILPPRLRPSRRPGILQKEKEEEPSEGKEEKTPNRTALRRPILSRPTLQRPPKRKPPPPPREEHRRPYASLTRTGTRPPFIPPRFRPTRDRTQKTTTTTTTIASTVTVQTSTPKNNLVTSPPLENEEHTTSTTETPRTRKTPPLFDKLFEDLVSRDQSSLPKPIHSKPIVESMIGPIHSNKPFVFPPDLLLPKPLPTINPHIDEDELLNLIQQENFNLHQDGGSRPLGHVRVSKPSFKPLPEIPESVKAQLPLGNDPELVSGLLELGGCNVYGRMFGVGEKIHDISGKCKACKCTKVGVQCLPFC